MNTLSASTLVAFLLLFSLNANAQLFGPQQSLRDAGGEPPSRSIFSADMDSDGDMDVLTAGGDNIVWYENQGELEFGLANYISSSASDAKIVYAVDLDNDGDQDVICANSTDLKINWYENLGSGSFGPEISLSTTAYRPSGIFSADLDNDGDIDVLSSSSYDNKIAWYENLGGGNLSSEIIISTSLNLAIDVHAADLDNDGLIDVIGGSNASDRIVWYKNLGGGNFGPATIIATSGSSLMAISAADLDNDGDIDVLGVDNYDDEVVRGENLGGGSFAFTDVISTSASNVRDISAVDLDKDGDMDLLVSCHSQVLWYENLSDGNFGPRNVIGFTLSINVAAATDLDNDGDLDVLARGAFDGIIWFENLSPQNCELPPIALSTAYTVGSPAGTLDLNWGSITNASAYQVEVKRISGTPKSKSFYTTTNELSITAPFPAGDAFTWRVRAACPTDSTDWTDAQPFNIPLLREAPTAQSLQEAEAGQNLQDGQIGQTLQDGTTGSRIVSSFRLFPNPASNMLQLEFAPLTTAAQLSVTDLTGRELVSPISLRAGASQLSLQTSSLQNGVYLLRFEMTDGSGNSSFQAERFSIQK